MLRWRALMIVAIMFAATAGAAPANYLLVRQDEIDAARRKAESHAWARRALEHLLQSAEKSLNEPVNIPDRGGQWPHWYSCKKDGSRLATDSDTRHRCPVCNTVYTGDPYDAVVLYGVHMRNAQAARNHGLAFRFTGRQAFARRAGEILTGYAGRYKSYARHNINGEDKVGGGKVMAQTLDESVWLIPIAWSYSLVRDTLPADARTRIENDLLLPAADVIREHRMGIHNIQCWKNSAVGLAGLATGRRDLVTEAIDDPERGFRSQIAKGVTDDGLWWEGSLGYHAYTLQALWPLAEAARLAGIDLYGDRYSRLYDAPLALALPDGEPPGFNDSAGANVKRSGNLYEIAFARWSKPAYGRVVTHTDRDSLEALLYGVEEAPTGPLVPGESVLLRSAGFAMLRAKGTAVAVRFGMHGGGHGHPDKLNIVTYGASLLFGLDPGSINYGVPLHREWYRSTIAHNTVVVDGSNQANRDGVAQSWIVDGDATTLVASANDVYPEVALQRRLKLSPGRLEDSFSCSSETERTYDWAFHAPGQLSLSLERESQTGALGERDGYQHITQVSRAQTDFEWWARWDNEGARLTLRFKAASGTQIFTGIGPGKDPAQKVPVIVVRRRAASTVFEVVHEMAVR